jgi:hypothetical protein
MTNQHFFLLQHRNDPMRLRARKLERLGDFTNRDRPGAGSQVLEDR